MNGKTRGDWEGEYTYVGARGSSVIDYIFVNKKVLGNIIKFKIEERMDSDHMLITLEVEEKEEERRMRKGEEKIKKEQEEKEVICRDNEAKTAYQNRTNELGWTEGQEEEIIEMKWERLKGLVELFGVQKKED